MKTKIRSFLAIFLCLAVANGTIKVPAWGVSSQVTQNLQQQEDSWQLSSLDQPNLVLDKSNTYPAVAGLGVTIYNICESDYSFDVRYRVAKNANRVSSTRGCFEFSLPTSENVSRFVAGVDFVINDRSTNDRKILVVGDYFGSRKNYSSISDVLIKAEQSGILVISDGYTDATKCQDHSILTVGGYSIYSPKVKNNWLNCIDIFAPEPDNRDWPKVVTLGPLNYVAEVAANYLSLNLSASVQETKNAILNNGDREYFDLSTCVACANRSLDSEFLLSDDPGYEAKLLTSVTDPEGHPMRETDFTNEIKDSSGNLINPKEIMWFKCDLGCYEIDSTVKTLKWPWQRSNWGSITGSHIIAVSSFTLPSGREYYLVSSLEKSIVENPISFPSHLEVDDYVTLNKGISGFWYLCSENGDLPTNQKPGDCKIISPLASNSIRLSPKYLTKYLRVMLFGDPMFYSQTSTSIAKSQPELQLTGANERLVDRVANVGVTVNPGNKPCPSSIMLTISERRPITKKSMTLKLRSCKASFTHKIRANTIFRFETRETSNSYSAIEYKTILATPSLNVQSPLRTFGKYTIRLRSKKPLNVTCNVSEDFFSFEGTRIGSRSYKLKLSFGSGSKTNTPNYIGVIKGMVMCPESPDFGDAYTTYKLFSY